MRADSHPPLTLPRLIIPQNLAGVIYVFRFRTEESLLGRAPVYETSTESSHTLTSREKMVEIVTCRHVQLYAAFL